MKKYRLTFKPAGAGRGAVVRSRTEGSQGKNGRGRNKGRRYQGHVPSVAFSFGSPYGTATLKYFQDQRNAALEKSQSPFSRGGHFPTLFSSNPDLVLSKRPHIRDRWLHTPVYTRFNLDSDRSAQLMGFYQTAQQHRKYYLDKTGMVPRVPYFVLPVKEWERYPLPTDFPPLTPEKKWHLLRVSPENLKTYQTFPSGKRVSPHERQKRDRYFEFRA
uniref:Ciliary microtubule inner protein 2C n=1 Tax=Ailuropoda melanoleuca TaxID=9646 RepID=A0A7N5JKG0_AILME